MPSVLLLTHLCRVNSSTLTLLTNLIPVEGVSVFFFLLLLLSYFIEIKESFGQSGLGKVKPRSAASDQDLHC